MLPIPDFIRHIARKAIAIPGRFIPYAIQKPVLSVALNEVFRRPLQQGELDFLNGVKVRIKVTDLNIEWLINVNDGGLTLINRELDDHVCISGKSLDFALLATRRADPDSLFFQRRIRIEGDTELGLGVKNTMDGMDWDDLPMPLRKLLKGMGAILAKQEHRDRER